VFSGLLLVAAVTLLLPGWQDRPARRAELARVDALTSFLAARTDPGDTVQPLDWTGVAPHAMLRARARIATPFLEDMHFYHHAADPYVRELRSRLIQGLSAARPRFVLEVDQPGWAPTEDSRHPFPALGRLLDAEYTVAARGDRWTAYERRPGR
jgi:hypothetical protein